MRSLFTLLLLATLPCPFVHAQQKPIEIKVVVINMFEIGQDTGDAPGEYQYWVEREHLDTIFPFPAGYHDLRLNTRTGVLGVLTGVGTARTAATIMALGLDPRFDLTHAYFLVAGIGGIDPQMGSLASAVWSDYIVDGDLAHEIDAREIPKDWKTGYVPLGKSTPYEQPRAARFGDDGNVYHLNKLSDFDGNYVALSAGATIAGGGNAVYLKNQNGVVIKVAATEIGLRFNLAASGVSITLQN